MATLKVAESWFKMDKKKMLEELKLMKESQRMAIAVKMQLINIKMTFTISFGFIKKEVFGKH